MLTAGLALGLFFTSFSSPVVNVLAVAVVLAALAQIGRGLAGRAAVLAAFAAFALGIFRLACDSIPAAWSAADAAGGALGRLAGWLSGCRFDVGASVAGLDFLVVAAAVYAGWIACTARATDVAGAAGRRATGSACPLAAVAALAGGQLGYLLLAANSQRLLSLLPPAAPSVLSGASHIGAVELGRRPANARLLEPAAGGPAHSRHARGAGRPLGMVAAGGRRKRGQGPFAGTARPTFGRCPVLRTKGRRKWGQAPFAGTARPTFGRCPVLRTKGACPLFRVARTGGSGKR